MRANLKRKVFPLCAIKCTDIRNAAQIETLVKTGRRIFKIRNLLHINGLSPRFVINCSKKGADLRSRSILGHASLKTTELCQNSSDKLTQAAVETLTEYGRCVPPAPIISGCRKRRKR